MGVLAQIQAISADSTKLATDQGALATLEAQVAAQQAVIAGDTTGVTADNAALSTALQASGPVFVVNNDGTASVYTFAADAPGFTITVAKPAT